MPAKQIKHVSVELEMSWVLREKTGVDALDAPIIHHILAEHIAKQIKVKDTSKIPNRFWSRIVFITNLMQQSVSLDGRGRFDIPSIDAPAEDITDFYDFMVSAEISEKQIDFFRDGLRKFDAPPNPDGGKKDPALNDESTASQTTMKTTTPISA